MIFDQITLENFGVYKDKQSVILSPPETNKPIILLGGLNGTGKTTFLDALQLVLYGKYARCSTRGNLSYEEFLKRSLNWKISSNENATLELQFRHIIDSQENSYKVTRSWGINKDTVDEGVIVELNGKFDGWLTENWYEYIENLLPLRISNLFFFDGEKIESLADKKQSAEFLNTAIRSLLGIDLIDKLATDLVVLQKRKKSQTQKTGEDWKIAELQEEVKHVEQQISETTTKKEILQREFDLLQNEFDEVEDHLRLQGGDLLQRQKDIENAKNITDEKLRDNDGELIDLASGLAPLLLVKNLINEVKSQEKYERKIIETKIVSNLLIKRDNELIDFLEKKSINEEVIRSIQQWMTKDKKKRFNNSKEKIYLNLSNETQSILTVLANQSLSYTKTEIVERIQISSKLQNSLVDHERNLAAVPTYDSLSDIINKRNHLRDSLLDIAAKIESVEIQLEKLPKEKEIKASKLNEIYKKQAELLHEEEDKKLILKYSEKSRETLSKFRVAVVRHHIEQIEASILESLNKLLRKKGFITRVKIDPENFLITLLEKNGSVISQERLSAGERQLLAVSILWGLAKASGQTLPAVIDTPMGRLDATHRSYLVESYFPRVSHQVLLLSTDEEITGNYFQGLEKHIGHSYRLEFDANEGVTQIKSGYLEEKFSVNRTH